MTEKKDKIKRRSVLTYFLFWIVFLIGVVGFCLLDWFLDIYIVTFESIFYTLNLPLEGTDSTVIRNAIDVCIKPAIITTVVYAIWVFIDCHRGMTLSYSGKVFGKSFAHKYSNPGHKLVPTLGFLLLAALLVSTFVKLDVMSFIKSRMSETSIYEDYYVSPDDVEISANGKPKNLIHIYVESMEIAYASKELGGNQDVNYIPSLTKLAEENISFSNTEGLGGFYSPPGTGWTMGAIFGAESGVPFSFPVDMEKFGVFAPGITLLGDVLEQKGYNQEFLCGSDVKFGGRDTYFTQHGNYDLFDWNTAQEEGYIPVGYKHWWGFEDFVLYDIAKDELTRLAKEDEPFNFSMLTVDTHFQSGYICDLCEDTYDTQLANVVVCTDKQLAEFIEWCKQQNFYDDTVIVIAGDHPRMDSDLLDGIESYYDRRVYNCFLNAGEASDYSVSNREFSTLDMFPTVLSAMGFNIEGDRLGLGTNLFSDKQTLTEELGMDYLNGEVSKYSKYYVDTFS